MLRRRVVTLAFGIVLVAILFISGALARWAWVWSNTFTDRLAAEAVVFSAGAFVLAIVASVIALAGYLASIQPPNLDISLWYRGQQVDLLTLWANTMTDNPSLPFDLPLEVTFRIANRSRFAARNTMCLVESKGVGMGSPGDDHWRLVELHPHRGWAKKVQWDGGTEHPIHGHCSRDISVYLRGAPVFPEPPDGRGFLVEVVAEGFRKRRTFPIEVLPPAAFSRRHPERSNEMT
jgi:hypothetical protein